MRAWLRQGKGETRVLEATSAPLNSTLFFHMDDHNEYHVETSQVLGTGSFSWVYACTHAGSGERFACKAIDISNKQRHGNFIRERQALDRMLRHRDRFGDQFYPSALIRMFSSLETLPRTGLLVVERLPTMTLHTYLERLEVNQMTLGADLVCHYADQLTEALSFMHRAGVTHLDIKTENIALDESRRQVILFDFGFAHCYNPGDTGEGLRINETHCSPMYMPPEILSARNKEEFYDPRLVDIWCLGHVFFELMTNHAFFSHAREFSDLVDLLTKKKPDATKQAGIRESPDFVELIRATLVYTPPSHRLHSNRLLSITRRLADKHKLIVVPNPGVLIPPLPPAIDAVTDDSCDSMDFVMEPS